MKGIKLEQEGSTEEDPSPALFSEEKEDLDKGYEDNLVESDQCQSYDIVFKGIQGNQENMTQLSYNILAERKKMTNIPKLMRVKRCGKVGKE
ncbi:hypothetical protein RJ640_029830 [Escallonia rubra]|uniref:Uncharacterized protein n=1 Tax=Escallonia rubra TaxID=112253 RepID=A0AA88RPS1_9ASTE|nr:hypothetical protein RJ640_029830 [Escallonia rubra]